MWVGTHSGGTPSGGTFWGRLRGLFLLPQVGEAILVLILACEVFLGGKLIQAGSLSLVELVEQGYRVSGVADDFGLHLHIAPLADEVGLQLCILLLADGRLRLLPVLALRTWMDDCQSRGRCAVGSHAALSAW